VITGSTVHVVVQVTGATIVDDTNEDIRPDQGHVHLYLDNTLWYMQYSLTKDIPVTPARTSSRPSSSPTTTRRSTRGTGRPRSSSPSNEEPTDDSTSRGRPVRVAGY
jgi:hypothetical protein